jgi:hypothetical protein
MTAQERLRRLLTANRSIVQELSLPAVLHRRRSGLANLHRRAQRYRGDFSVDNAGEGGLRLQWSIPLHP